MGGNVMTMDEHLLGVLQLAQDAGVIGNTDSLKKSLERVYLSLPWRLSKQRSGARHWLRGGLPGLVIAHDRPDVHVTLIDRREKRTDLLQRQATRLRRHQPGLY